MARLPAIDDLALCIGVKGLRKPAISRRSCCFQLVPERGSHFGP
jgi:hypothetical protein